MIDEKGRLFGKVNLIDLIIIIIILAAVAFLGLRLFGAASADASAQSVDISFFCEEAPDFVVDKLEEGAVVYDYTDDVYLGTLSSFDTGESISYALSDDGTNVLTSKDGYLSVDLTARCSGILGDNGVTVDGKLLAVGHTLVMYAGYAKLYLRVSDIVPAA